MDMKALKYLDELIEVEKNYLSEYDTDKQPENHKKRLEDLLKCRQEVFDLYNVVDKMEQVFRTCIGED